MSIHRGLLAVFGLSIFQLDTALGADWPQGYTVLKDSTSPNGKYGLLVLSREVAISNDQTADNKIYLANLTTRQSIGEIEGVDYFERQNHAGLEAVWAPDSNACVVEYDARYGWESVFVLMLNNDSFEQIDIGKHIDAMQKRIFNGYMNGYFRFGDGKLKVRALSYTNPKQFDDVPTYNGVFKGTFDLRSRKWMATDVRKMKEEEWSNLQTAYDDNVATHMIVAKDDSEVPKDFTGKVFRSEQEKFDDLDQTMNAVYQSVRAVLASNRFGKIKQEQMEWLKKRERAKSADEKSKMTEDRTKALQDLLW